jgi:hypothetical protein
VKSKSTSDGVLRRQKNPEFQTKFKLPQAGLAEHTIVTCQLHTPFDYGWTVTNVTK